MRRGWKAAALATGALLLGGAALWRAQPRPEEGPPAQVAAEASPERRAPPGPRRAQEEARAAQAPEEAASPAARSLRGTEVDGALRVDERGDLILGPEVIAFFDYFFSATGEEPDAAIRARILAAIRERLDGPAAMQAEALLDRYVGFREAARALRGDMDSAADPEARLEAIRRLRREHFGEEEAERLFGDEEREAAVAAAQRRAAQDPSLSPEEREAKIAELEAELPEAAREARAKAREPLAQHAEEEALRAAGATQEELREHRVATVGEEAAARLGELDRRREEWSLRVEAFREERARIRASIREEGARGAAEQALLERSFTEQEQLRVRAILRAQGEPLGE